MTNNEELLLKHFLFPGTLIVDPRPHLVTTVLGSCVSVCFWDCVTQIGGMNHFMLPFWNGEGLATPKYGNIAMEKLMDRFMELGCRRDNLVAKVFGGANVMGIENESFMIGDRNITLAFQILDDYRIRVVSNDVGGRCGRKIIMNTATGVVLLARGKQER